MTKQFAFQQSRGNGRAVHANKGALAPRAEPVDRPRNQLLSRSCFSMKQDRGIGGGNNRHLVKHFLEGWAPADDILEAVVRANFCFQMHVAGLRDR